jgi:transcriptional regulator with XRE-family HTH domain
MMGMRKPLCDFRAMSDLFIEWIRRGLRSPGKNQSGLAAHLGVAHPQITMMLQGKRRIKADELPKIAEYLETNVPIVTYDAATGRVVAKEAELVERVPVYPMIRGVVAGGRWLEMDTWSSDGDGVERYPTPVFVPENIDASAVYVLKIEGNSVNRKAPDGGFVVCLPLDSAPRNFRSGDWVVAERRRGDLIETTVKQVSRNDEGQWELLPLSDDPKHQAPITVGEHPDEVVSVKAFAIDFISPGTKF